MQELDNEPHSHMRQHRDILCPEELPCVAVDVWQRCVVCVAAAAAAVKYSLLGCLLSGAAPQARASAGYP
jgi:hypothetical protein